MKKFFIILASIFLLLSFSFLGLFIYEQSTLNKEQEEIVNLLDEVIITEIPDETIPNDTQQNTNETVNTETEKPTETTKKPTNNTPQYTTPSAINIDKLLQKNKDVAGWIYLENSPLNYPFLFSTGNEYLRKNINGQKSTAGSIYTYDNQTIEYPDKIDKNVVLYGHNMKNGTMFSYVNNLYKNSNYLKNGKNKYIFIYNKEHILKYQIYSIYKIEKNSNFSQIYFKDNTDFLNFCKTTYDRSIYKDFKPEFVADDTILTLATCSSNDSQTYRIILHAVLVETSENNY